MKNPGKIIKLEDGRYVIMFQHQPLIAKLKYVLYLCDEYGNEILDENQKPKTIIRTFDEYKKENQS